ncbi:MAG: 16S rRNA (uracil(1498)-N(3))-methyltransferase [Methylibium sp.]|uniref:16S rRNA (uracil(1498)-N(3))-methyltransferase n=1 Tax=Methylibium sp. TaxID=2067992 RepID=UPI0018198614|nr:16S rRNA (uracil(1498)-N(3))-methyltransferase [Methylibium sp.]MBA3596702.1 16S rRNA (uracil(1498)-N(3))-methyltransferase [Methylibium sp.]
MPRFHVDLPLAPGLEAALPAAAARHVQVLRLQPGDAVLLFDGGGADWSAELLQIGRSVVQVRVGASQAVDCELPMAVTLAVGMPANERMDWLIEKATELGVAEIQPLVCERSVLRLSGERAGRKLTHWQGVASAAAEQCGRARLPTLQPVRSLAEWLAAPAAAPASARFVLSLSEGTQPIAEALGPAVRTGSALVFLSGPEGGLSPREEAAALGAGLQPVTLGRRVLRAETAPLAVLAALAALCA